jgi:processive 1,2-diacylglycerol beta-glucosyltransferase
MKRILILYGFEHSGHHAAALALREAFCTLDPGVEVHLLNFFVFASRLLERVSTGAFYRVVKSTPRIWDGIYTNPRSETRFTRFRQFVRTLAPRGVEDAMRAFDPEAVVCTQSFPCGMVNDFKEGHGSDIPLYAVLTDFFVPSYWVYERVDSYYVASPEARDELLTASIEGSRIVHAGIPISPRFAKQLGRAEARRMFCLPEDSPVILVVGGWSGWGALESLAFELHRVGHDGTVVVVTGRNREQYESIAGRACGLEPGLRVMRYVQRMDALMRASDVLVGKAGGMTAAEALSVGLPLVLVDSLPGQERANAEYLCRHGVALMARSVGEAATLAAELASSVDRRLAMRRRALSLARPEAALVTARNVFERLNAPLYSL